jgi:hypothetical protein
MPGGGGTHKLSSWVGMGPAKPTAVTNSEVEEHLHVPAPEVLGTVGQGTAKPEVDWRAIAAAEEGPPPWETDDPTGRSKGARRFIKCPDEWILYWCNPKEINVSGWRGWQPVMASDPRVTVLIPSAISSTGNVRRGGEQGDLLAYMPRHWYEQRKKEREERIRRQTQSSVDRQEELRHMFARGDFPGVTLEGAKHPTHTQADGRTFEP